VDGLQTFSELCGIVYFLAWSISFIPQVVLNYRRKSTVGLSYDFLLLNLTGYVCYTLFTTNLYFNPIVVREYLQSTPNARRTPVDPSDVGFAIFGLLMTAITIAQVFVYESGGQKPSVVAVALGAGLWLTVGIALVLSGSGVATWLDFVNVCSYCKLIVTATKYPPQAWKNFKRKSTTGWSITNILLDLTGGAFSFVQQICDSVILGNTTPISGNPVKAGLSWLSIAFDILFIVQHYCLYRGNNADAAVVAKTDEQALLANSAPVGLDEPNKD
jgi:cystinosin